VGINHVQDGEENANDDRQEDAGENGVGACACRAPVCLEHDRSFGEANHPITE
jgi:hypothetical protein